MLKSKGNPPNLTSAGRRRRRALGIYYTPPKLSEAIAHWAVRSSADTILEPSFGGCGFLAAARDQLVKLSAKKPGNGLAGCDIDQAAFVFLRSLVGKRPSPSRYLKKDFLALKPGAFPIDRFTCVLGNPPFTRHHEIEESVKKRIKKLVSSFAEPLPKTAGLWAHFVLHSLHFLSTGGRIGLVLPGSFLFADYAKPLRDTIRRNFGRSTVIKLNYQTFLDVGAEERAVVLLAEEFRTQPGPVWTEMAVADEADAIRTIKESRKKIRSKPKESSPSYVQTAYEQIATSDCVKSLGQVAKIDIGVVTGDNRFFILHERQAEEKGLSKSIFTRIIARAGHARGLHLCEKEFENLREAQAPCLLLTPPHISDRHSPLRRYLASMDRRQRRKGVWLNKRDRWYCPDVGSFPDAALTYMNHHSPRLILLDGSVTCTNTLHRVWIRNQEVVHKKLVALSLLTAFSQISAEVEGRSYGGGVLKLEPSNARRVKVVVPESLSDTSIAQAFDAADIHLKKGQNEQAYEIADDLLLKPILGERFSSLISELRSVLSERRAMRNIRAIDRKKASC